MTDAAHDRLDMLGLELYGRKPRAREVVGGPDALVLRDALTRIRELSAEVDRLRELTTWRPIAEAPRDGAVVLATDGLCVRSVQWLDDGLAMPSQATPARATDAKPIGAWTHVESECDVTEAQLIGWRDDEVTGWRPLGPLPEASDDE